MSRAPLLAVERLRVGFTAERGPVSVVEGVDLAVERGRTLGLVGESGCGKSVTAMAVMRLLATPPAVIGGGRVWFDGVDLLVLDESEMRRVRGNRLAMIFQEPMTSLNPTFTIGFQIAETLRLHRAVGARAARAAAAETLERVGVGGALARLDQYPHQLSGGLRQRVMIALAIICRPALLIADEPTTALDVTIQAQILTLLAELRTELGMAMLLITHDLGVVAGQTDTVAVMYAGRVVETAPTAMLFAHPRHPYTAGLLAATPRLGRKPGRLPTIPGMAPGAMAAAAGCRFAPRCARAIDRCRVDTPALEPAGAEHRWACWNPLP